MPHKRLPEGSVTSTKNYPAIDLVKFICAILILIIHIPPFAAPVNGSLSPLEQTFNFWMQQYLNRLAVPFYFVCSGFFLFRKMPSNEIDPDRIRKYCFKLIRLFGLWSILSYVAWSGHLWYLSANLVAVVFISLCLYRGLKLRWLITIVGVFYVLGLLGDSYFGLIKPFVSSGTAKTLYGIYRYFVKSSKNGFCIGSAYVLMGYVFAQGKIRLKTGTAAALFAASLTCLFAEVFLLRHYQIATEHNLYIFHLPAIFFLFAFVTSLELKEHPVYARLRTVGMLIYFTHMLVWTLISFSLGLFYGAFKIDLQPIQFYLTLPAVLLLAFGLEKLSHKEKFKWLLWLVS